MGGTSCSTSLAGAVATGCVKPRAVRNSGSPPIDHAVGGKQSWTTLLLLRRSSSEDTPLPRRRRFSLMRKRNQRERFACNCSRLLPIFRCKLSPNCSLSGVHNRIKVPFDDSRSCNQNSSLEWMTSACSPETEWSGMTTSLWSAKRPSEAVPCCAKLTQCRSFNVR